VAIITGSSGRLGSAIAKALAEAGCNCICHYNHNERAVEVLVEQIRAMERKVLAVKADLCEDSGIKNLFDRAAELGTAQVLINSAAVFSRQPLEQVTFEQAQKVLDLNLIAPILASRAFARQLSDEFGDTGSVVGKIINIADVGGIRPWAGYVLYCSSKAGLIGATKTLAKELAPAISVNSIAPGVVTWPSDSDKSYKQRQLSFIPVGRVAETNEITDSILFLLKNDYITGQVLNVDGGRCI
jgi:pteridine reductase